MNLGLGCWSLQVDSFGVTLPGDNILASRVLELWLCVGDFTTLSLGLFILKTSLGCLGGSWEQAASEVSPEPNTQGACSVPGKVVSAGG